MTELPAMTTVGDDGTPVPKKARGRVVWWVVAAVLVGLLIVLHLSGFFPRH